VRSTDAQEGARGAALAAVSEDTSHMKERRVVRDVALASAGAEAYVCPRVEKNRREGASTITERRGVVTGCARVHKSAGVTWGNVDAS